MKDARRSSQKSAVAALVATAFLTAAMVSSQPSAASPLVPQDTIKVQVKVEGKVEAKVTEKVETKPAADAVEVKKAEAKEAVKEVVTEKAEAKAAPAKVAIKGAVKAVQVMPAAPVRAIPAGGPVELDDATFKQFIQQFQPILHAELRLLTSACEPSPTQRREIALAGGVALKEAAREMGQAQQGMNNGRGINFNNLVDPRKAIRDAVEKAAKAKLSPEQLDRLRKELDEQAADRKEAVLLAVVANLDKSMILSTEQRDKICDKLRTNWNDQIYPTLETATIYEGYFPMIPNQLLSPILNEDQMKIWRGAQKIHFASVRNYSFFNGQQQPEGGSNDDEDVKAAIAVEEKKKP